MKAVVKTVEPVEHEGPLENIRPLYLEALTLVERLHRRLLDVIKDEFDRRSRADINSVQALLLYNIGEKELTAGELRTRGYYRGSNVSYYPKKLAAVGAALGTYLDRSGEAPLLPSAAQAQAGQRATDVLKQMMSDLNREMQVRVTERDPGNGSAAHRHPGHHTFGYVLEGTYEVKVDNGPVRQLKAGEAFY